MFPNYLCNFHFFLSTVDIISAIEFDKSGDHLATGDRGGRVVLFERTDTKDVSLILASAISFITKHSCERFHLASLIL